MGDREGRGRREEYQEVANGERKRKSTNRRETGMEAGSGGGWGEHQRGSDQ